MPGSDDARHGDAEQWAGLTQGLFEKWEERACVMHYDAGIPWQEAERLALADVLGHADPIAGDAKAESAKAEQAAPRYKQTLEKGPYA